MTAIAQRRVAGATAIMILLYLLQVALFAPSAEAHGTHACDPNYTEFTFVFVNGTVIAGDNCEGSDYYFDGKDNEAFFPGTGGSSDYPNGPGMQIHVSCSDQFTDGWSNSGGNPDIDDDPNWRIAEYTIQKHTAGSPAPCSEVFVTTTSTSTTSTSTTSTSTTSTSTTSTTQPTTTTTQPTTTTTEATTTTTQPTTTTTEAVTTTTAEPEVLGTTITTLPEVSADTLPFTGFEAGDTARLGMLAMLAGGLMLFAVRGRKEEEGAATDIGGWSNL